VEGCSSRGEDLVGMVEQPSDLTAQVGRSARPQTPIRSQKGGSSQP
jgi:hypothetical protein